VNNTGCGPFSNRYRRQYSFCCSLAAGVAPARRNPDRSSAHVFRSSIVFIEIFKHKDRIVAATELEAEDLLGCLNALLARITFVEEGAIPIGTWMEGRRLCAGVDAKDAPFVTLALHVDGMLWTLDAELEAGLRRQGFERFFRV
jgi:predicted nucleic acid-binding protein